MDELLSQGEFTGQYRTSYDLLGLRTNPPTDQETETARSAVVTYMIEEGFPDADVTYDPNDWTDNEVTFDAHITVNGEPQTRTITRKR